jgi:hypothetical protein
MGDTDRPHAVAGGAKDRAAHLAAAAKRKPAAVGKRDEPVVEQGVWRGDAREARDRAAPAGRDG